MSRFVDRRKRRSPDPIIALHYQLSAVRTDAGLDALVLVDDRGCLVAGAGAWPVCEELAAYAPFLARRVMSARPEVATLTTALEQGTAVRTVPLDGMDALLCAKGTSGRDLTVPMQRAAAGCQRILGGED